MAETSIEWCDFTFNPWEGCTKVSPGCANCYAEARANRFGTVLWGPQGTRRVASESYWKQPLKWDREAKAAGERRRVFCASLADVFEDWQGPMVDAKGEVLFLSPKGNWLNGGSEQLYSEGHPLGVRPPEVTMAHVRDRLFRLIDATPNLDWLLLTKRPENIARMMPPTSAPPQQLADAVWEERTTKGLDYRPNVWLGVSVENREHGLPRVDVLRTIPAAVRFLSIEPLLEDIGTINLDGIHLCIVGGESGAGARPCNVDWIRSIIRQCKAAGVACFVKQLGANYCDELNGVCGKSTKWPFDVWPSGPARRITDPKGGDPAEWPEDLRVREMPEAGV